MRQSLFKLWVRAMLWVAIALSLGCSSKWVQKLSKEELKNLLVELYKADCIMDQLGYTINDTIRMAIDGEIFAQYGITRSEFDSIIYHYNKEKPRYFADIARRASATVESELTLLRKESLYREKLLNKEENRPQFLPLDSIGTWISERDFPQRFLLSSRPHWIFYTVSINEEIPSGSTLSAALQVENFIEPSKANSTLPYLELAYYQADTLAFRDTMPIKSRGSYEVKLHWKEKGTAGRLILTIWHGGGKKSLTQPFLLQSLKLSSDIPTSTEE